VAMHACPVCWLRLMGPSAGSMSCCGNARMPCVLAAVDGPFYWQQVLLWQCTHALCALAMLLTAPSGGSITVQLRHRIIETHGLVACCMQHGTGTHDSMRPGLTALHVLSQLGEAEVGAGLPCCCWLAAVASLPTMDLGCSGCPDPPAPQVKQAAVKAITGDGHTN
jgi:hypothetical protein